MVDQLSRFPGFVVCDAIDLDRQFRESALKFVTCLLRMRQADKPT
jgi:hypothetical protein